MPVAINTVTLGSNSTYYNNAGGAYPFEYAGLTDPLMVSMTGLSAGTHRLKLAIADSGDHTLDSGLAGLRRKKTA